MTEQELHDGLERIVTRGLGKMQELTANSSKRFYRLRCEEHQAETNFTRERNAIIARTVYELEKFVRQEI